MDYICLLFQISVTDMVRIQESMVGIVTTLDGLPIERGQIAGKLIEGHNNFQDFDTFIKNGGNRGLQPQVILAGSYNLNPWAIQIEETPMSEIPIGYVGVVISYIGQDGKDLTGSDFTHGNIVEKGYKGVWLEPLGPGKYPINKYTMKVELVPTTNLVLNWATARSKAHNLDKNLSTITVRSKDGFPFNLDVAQIIHVPSIEAPKVIAYNHFGNRLATILGLNMENAENIEDTGKFVAMQVAAMSPVAIDKDDVSKEMIDREMEIGKDQARAEGKPEEMVEKIALGKLNKFYKESTLLNQEFINDNYLTVRDFISKSHKDLTVTKFYRLQLGA